MRRSPGGRIRLLAVAGILLVSLPACGPRPVDSVDSGNVLYGITSRIRGFDPVKSGDVASAIAISKVYEGLLQYAYLDRPYRLEPLLADGMPVVSADGLVYTFKIRQGIYFADDPCFNGVARELQADDFVYAIKRVADVKTESTGFWAFNDRIEGLDAFKEASSGPDPTDYDRPVSGLQAIDRYTFQIRLTRPYPQLLWILTLHYACAIPHEAVRYYGEEFLNHPVGTGPYILKSWQRNYRVEFVRNPVWGRTGRTDRYPEHAEAGDAAEGLLEDAGQPVPFIDRIVQYVIDDASTQWLKFVAGEVESSGISRDNWEAVITPQKDLAGHLERRGIRLYRTPTLDVYYVGFNMDDPVVGPNLKLRRALTCAFDSEQWVKFYNDRITRARGPIPPGVAGYDDEPALFPFDLDRARTLLAEAGFPEGVDRVTGQRLKLTLELGSSDSSTRESVELMMGFFRKIGVTLVPSYNNWPTFLSKMDRRQCQLYLLGWVADYPDAENFLQLFYGPNQSPGPNHSNYINPEFDRLYEAVRTMPDSPERTARYRTMARMIMDDAPWIFMHHPMDYSLQHRWVHNYKPHDFPYGMVKYYRLDPADRQAWKEQFSFVHWLE